MNLSFSGKTALFCGGNCELALALAPLVIAEGIRPVLSCRSEAAREHIVQCLNEYSGAFDTCFMDFDSPSSLTAAFSALDNNLDYLVDFVQGDYENLVAAADPDKTGRYMAAHVAARADMLKRAARIMMHRRFGRLVFVSSAAAGRPNPGQGFYAAAKLAAEAMYKNLALELGSKGLSTVTLRPGYVEAGRGKPYIEKNREALLRQIPSRSFVSTHDLASTLLFLLSDQARHLNATEITMDGGLSAGKQRL